jgi:hypothetical protein
MLVGRAAEDALVYAPRICGICSVSQSVAAARALAGVRPAGRRGARPAQWSARHQSGHAVENLADHLTHFYLFFMPDFARATYAAEPWHAAAAERFTAMKGRRRRRCCRARFDGDDGRAGGQMAPYALHPAGRLHAGDHRAEQARLRLMLAGFRAFCETVLFAAPLEKVAGLTSREALYEWADRAGMRRISCACRAFWGFRGLGGPACGICPLAPMPGPKGLVRARRVPCADRGRRPAAAGRDHRGYFPCLVSRRGGRRAWPRPRPT